MWLPSVCHDASRLREFLDLLPHAQAALGVGFVHAPKLAAHPVVAGLELLLTALERPEESNQLYCIMPCNVPWSARSKFTLIASSSSCNPPLDAAPSPLKSEGSCGSPAPAGAGFLESGGAEGGPSASRLAVELSTGISGMLMSMLAVPYPPTASSNVRLNTAPRQTAQYDRMLRRRLAASGGGYDSDKWRMTEGGGSWSSGKLKRAGLGERSSTGRV